MTLPVIDISLVSTPRLSRWAYIWAALDAAAPGQEFTAKPCPGCSGDGLPPVQCHLKDILKQRRALGLPSARVRHDRGTIYITKQ
jgi:hypothetical protein